jgi:hypothetical protein
MPNSIEHARVGRHRNSFAVSGDRSMSVGVSAAQRRRRTSGVRSWRATLSHWHLCRWNRTDAMDSERVHRSRLRCRGPSGAAAQQIIQRPDGPHSATTRAIVAAPLVDSRLRPLAAPNVKMDKLRNLREEPRRNRSFSAPADNQRPFPPPRRPPVPESSSPVSHDATVSGCHASVLCVSVLVL